VVEREETAEDPRDLLTDGVAEEETAEDPRDLLTDGVAEEETAEDPRDLLTDGVAEEEERARPHEPSPGRRRAATALGVLCALLALGGVGFLAYPTWTDIRAARTQDRLEQAFGTEEAERDVEQGTVAVGSPLTRIRIPRLGVDALVVEGVTLKALRAGAGHYPETPLPGEPGNVSLAGHRTTFGAPFSDIDRLVPGDEIVLETPVGRYRYQVSDRPWVTDPADWRVVGPAEGSVLTLTTCEPRGSADRRLVVRAHLAESLPA
jgi:sortase A